MDKLEFVFSEKFEIKSLILYTLYQIKETAHRASVQKQFLLDFLTGNVNVCYFDLVVCFDELYEGGFINVTPIQYKDVAEITDEGMKMTEHFFAQVPLSVRDLIDTKIASELLEFDNNQTVKVDYWYENDHCYTSCFEIADKDSSQMKFTISFPDKKSAQALTKIFKMKPDKYYKKFIDLCLEAIEDCEKETGGKQ